MKYHKLEADQTWMKDPVEIIVVSNNIEEIESVLDNFYRDLCYY